MEDKLTHLQEINTTWRKHFVFAFSIIFILSKTILYLTVHAFFPNIFKKRASDLIKHIHSELEK